MYRVVKTFADLQDGKRLYQPGDTFPRPGLEVTATRLAALASSDNAAHMVLIEAVEQPERKPRATTRKRVSTDD